MSDTEKQSGSRFHVGTGDIRHDVLSDSTIENSTIGHIGDKFVVEDGGTVLTADAVVAQEAIKQARIEDLCDAVGTAVKDAVIPGHKLVRDVKELIGIEDRTSRFDRVVNEFHVSDGKDRDVTDDTEFSG